MVKRVPDGTGGTDWGRQVQHGKNLTVRCLVTLVTLSRSAAYSVTREKSDGPATERAAKST